MTIPCYITLVGTKDDEGIVITRDRNMTLNSAVVTDDNWYLVQTNEDHYRDECSSRCQSARANL